jgi:hypothetical protein|nr:MAG TPA: protein of unknown function (DUF4494) [Caudoviricetes sp.]
MATANNIWYNVKTRYIGTTEDGITKAITGEYLTAALSFTEAETKTSEGALLYGLEEFDVIAMSRTKFSEIVYGDEEADKWFKCKINATILDERSGREKKTPIFFCVNADNALEAHHRLDEHLKKTMMDYTVEQVDETKIIEVIK